MKDNSDYWKDLLGDDYGDELPGILQNPSQPTRPGAGNMPGKDNLDDSGRFYDFDLSSSRGMQESDPGWSQDAAEKQSEKDNDDDFDVTFDFDKEYRDIPDDRPIKPRREKRTGCLGGVLYAVFFICVSLLLASLLWLAATDVLGLGKNDEIVQVTVPQDYAMSDITNMLKEDGLIKYKFLFKLYAGFSDASEKITPGTYELNKNYDYRALVYGMSAHGGKRVEVGVTIPEGFTVKQIINLLEVNAVCPAEDLWDTVTNHDFNYDFLDSSTLGDEHRLEGFLFPDTYKFYVGDSPTAAIEKMLKNFKAKFKEEYITRAEELGYSVRDIVIIAAMIEKEAGSLDEQGTIASVIYNRLGSTDLPYLQIDATIYYAIADTGEDFSTDVDSPYNTYQVKGLPAGPIANPGVAAIKAALYPDSTKYYYYALNKDKTHNFYKDYDSFIAFVNSDEYGG